MDHLGIWRGQGTIKDEVKLPIASQTGLTLTPPKLDLEFRVWDLGFRSQDLGLRV